MALSINSGNLQGLLDSGQPLVIDFWAEWCGPCRMVAPLIEELAAEYAGRVTIGKCDVDENNDLAVRFAVRNIPTILFIKGLRHGQQARQTDRRLSKKRIGRKAEQNPLTERSGFEPCTPPQPAGVLLFELSEK